MSLPPPAPDAAASRHDMHMSTPPSHSPQGDELTRQKIAAIIEEQFDLEILLRHAERASIAQELAKAERMLEDLRHAILSERQGAPFGNSTFSRSQGVPTTTTGTRGRTSRRATANYGPNGRQPEAIYAVRADGQFVRLGCPRCDRYDFGSQQGLINHMRLSHKHFFKSTEDCVRYCGVVVPSSEVPPDHPCRSRVVFSSLGMNDPSFQQANSFKPTIKTYDEDVDLDLDDGHRAGIQKPPASTIGTTPDGSSALPPPSQQQQQQPRSRKNSISSSSSNADSGSESESSGEEESSGVNRRRSSLALVINRPQKGKPKSSGLHISNGVRGSADDTDGGGTSGTEVDNDDIQRPRHPAGKGPMRKYGGSGGSAASSATLVRLPPPAPAPAPTIVPVPTPTPTPAPASASAIPIPQYQQSPRQQRDSSMSVSRSRPTSAASSRAPSPGVHPMDGPPSPVAPPSPVVAAARPPASTQPSSTTLPMATLPTASAPTQSPTVITPPPPAAEGVPIITFGPSAVYADLPAPLDTLGSRFYVKRRIVVGNVSKYLPEHKRDPRLRDFSYKWMIYVDGTPSPEDITAYVRKVEFYLHESYKPNHIVTIDEPPFHLSRYAWGETTVKIMLYFKDERNKPVEVFHKLELDPTHCGRQVLGNERSVDLELDRNTDFKPVTPFRKHTKDSGHKNSSSFSSSAQAQARSMILQTKADVAMADALTDEKIDEDERELQDTFQKDVAGQKHRLAVQQQQQNVESVRAAAASTSDVQQQQQQTAALLGLQQSSAEVLGGMATGFYQTRVAATRLKYCKACGSPWQSHKDASLGVVGLESTTPFLNRENNGPIPNCPHHPTYYATKDNLTLAGTAANLMSVGATLSLPLIEQTTESNGTIVGRTKKRFALDMLKECGIVDERGHPILSRLQQQQQQMRHQMAAARGVLADGSSSNSSMVMLDEDQDMDLDIGDSELAVTSVSGEANSVGGRGGAPFVVTPAHLKRLEDAFQRLPVYEGRRSEIDWVLSVMDDLRLKTLALDGVPVGSGRMMTTDLQRWTSTLNGHKNEAEAAKNDDERMKLSVDESIRQRAIIGGLLVHVTKGFLNRILSKAVDVHRREAEVERGPAALMMELDDDGGDGGHGAAGGEEKISKKLLAPHHVRQALELNPEELDFLTSDYEDMRGVSDAMAGL